MSDLSLPPNYAVPTVPTQVYSDIKLVKLAREIAMDVNDIETILKNHELELIEFEHIKKLPRFNVILSAEIEAWNSAVNTSERVKLKAASMIEEWLPELYARMNDRSENLLAKIKGGELVSRLAGLGSNARDDTLNAADRVQITINLGADNKLEVTKAIQPRVIEHNLDEVAPAQDIESED